MREQSNLFYRRIFGTFTTCNLQTIKELIAIIEMICEFRWSDAFSGCYVVDIYHCNKNQGVVGTCKLQESVEIISLSFICVAELALAIIAK